MKRGKNDDVLFERPSYTTVNDPYQRHQVDKERLWRGDEPDGHKACHDFKFKPAKCVKERLYTSSYEHIRDRVDVKKNYRDEDGAVVKGPANINTCGPKKGQHGKMCYFNSIPKAIPDDFNWPRKCATKEMIEAKKLE